MPPALSYLLGVLLVIAALVAIVAWLYAGRIIRRKDPDDPDPPDNYDLHFEHVTFTARDGMQLGGWLSSARGERRATVVFCPGMYGSMDGDTHLVPAFVRAGFDVLQFDWRAHGVSDGRRMTFGLRELDDLLGAVDFLQSRGVKRIGLLGFSMGGAVALRAAARDQRVRCVACDGGYVRLSSTLSSALRDLFGLPLRPLVWLLMRMIEVRLGGARLSEANPLPVVDQISPRPVLFIHGADDEFVPAADQDAIFAACGEPKSLWRVEGAGHRDAMQQQPETYRERVVGFFRQHLR